jgi:hypothetical protein
MNGSDPTGDPASESAELHEMRADIAETRAHLSETLEELQEKLSPRAVTHAAVAKVENEAEETAGRLHRAGGSLVGAVKARPLPATLVGIGLVLVFEGWRRARLDTMQS